MSLHDQAIGLFVFFPVLTTITVGLRLFVRTRLCKGAFGWDDVALVVTYVGLLLWVGFAWKSVDAGFGSDKWPTYTSAKNDICYIISGVVKVSVALVLYRLDERLFMRAILITDMAVCTIWTVVVTLILGLGCQENSTWDLGESVCRATNYAQEASYVFFNVLHVLIPIVILWGVQIRGNLKWAVVCLFSVGILAAIAAILKLRVYVELYNPTPSTDHVALWYQSMIWAVCEHGLSLFAASVLAIRPFFTYLSSSFTTLSSSLNRSGSDKNASGRRNSSRVSGSPSWPLSPPEVRTTSAARGDVELEARRESRADASPTKAAYTMNGFSESSRKLIHESNETRGSGDIV